MSPIVRPFVDRLRTRLRGSRHTIAQHALHATPPSPHIAPSQSPDVTLLDPQVLAKIGKLELLAKTVVDGVMSGKHRSTHKGGCSEFSEHRPYADGDDIRLIDWRIYAKRDRYYVKQFDDETNLHAWMVMDTSASMAFGQSTVSKFDYARMTCASVARLLLRQRDSIGLSMETRAGATSIPPRPQPNPFLSICRALETAVPAGESTITQQLAQLTPRLKRRGLVAAFSDCFGDLDEFVGAAEQLRLRGHDVVIFQILAPEEIHFNFRRPAIFEDLEGRRARLNVNPGAVRRRYLERFNAFQSRLHEAMLKIDCDLLTLPANQDLGDALVLYLRRRAARRRAASA